MKNKDEIKRIIAIAINTYLMIIGGVFLIVVSILGLNDQLFPCFPNLSNYCEDVKIHFWEGLGLGIFAIIYGIFSAFKYDRQKKE